MNKEKYFKLVNIIYDIDLFVFDENLNTYSTNIKNLKIKKSDCWQPPFIITPSPIYIRMRNKEFLAFEFNSYNDHFIQFDNYSEDLLLLIYL